MVASPLRQMPPLICRRGSMIFPFLLQLRTTHPTRASITNRALLIDARMSLILYAVLALAACGGGGGYIPPPASSAASYTVGGVVLLQALKAILDKVRPAKDDAAGVVTCFAKGRLLHFPAQ